MLASTTAQAHGGSHTPSRHDLAITVTADRVQLEGSVSLPAELLEHDPVLAATTWLVAGLELRTGATRADLSVRGPTTLRTVHAELPLPPGPIDVVVADATLLGEATELRWSVHDRARPVDIDGLDDVFDGRRRRSLRGVWVRGHPRELVLHVGPAPATGGGWLPWALAGLGLATALGLIPTAVRRGRRRGPASPPPAPP